MLIEGNPIEHCRGDGAHGSEEVEGYARAGAIGHRAKRLLEPRRVNIAKESLLGLVLAVDAVDVPEPLTGTDLEFPVEGGHAIVSVDRLTVPTSSKFGHAPVNRVVAGVGYDIDAKRIERVCCVYRDRIEQ